ncbi:hypothetical protein PC129_g1221 [Phytophthora cactorum]|nr:hypothetical protein PC114_g1915 [Phytophthora cactorum]KAG2952806.1 hypothetical protein PC117_g2534 [Phytophthora cactorum]KAG2996801.1 hypothetical protein PC118_g2279 [Phytophthora cactorum]KAG3101715.1 hypothetical protein PC121_g1343 [Phytophthora cactorum]KAG3190760.1 hypothetical protein C6341_g1595 [Phytophthora cactorum]
MNVPLSQWTAPKVSRLWSAKGDDRCSPPRSDDYKDWTLMQLKREITQRQLKTNPRRRNKDAFVRVLLSNDQEQAQIQTQNAPQNQQQTLEDTVMFVPTSTADLQNIYVNNGDQQQQQQQQKDIYGTNTAHQQPQQDVYGNNTGQQQPRQPDLYSSGQQQQQDMYMEHQPQQQEIYTNSGEQQQNFMPSDVNVGVMEPAPLTSPAPTPQIPAQMQTPMAVAAPAPETLETEVEAPQSFEASKRQRVEQTEHESEGSENCHSVAASEQRRAGTSVQQVGKGSTEYLRRKLSIQAARLEIESRRLDIETKREQRNSELHAVQLALANEQLQQAKMTTQKMKTEWMVEQMIQKKRLNDAGISPEDSAALGMYLS